MTSSPGLILLSPNLEESKEEKATKLAEDPELTVIKFLTFKKLANLNSKSLLNLPVVSQPSMLA